MAFWHCRVLIHKTVTIKLFLYFCLHRQTCMILLKSASLTTLLYQSGKYLPALYDNFIGLPLICQQLTSRVQGSHGRLLLDHHSSSSNLVEVLQGICSSFFVVHVGLAVVWQLCSSGYIPFTSLFCFPLMWNQFDECLKFELMAGLWWFAIKRDSVVLEVGVGGGGWSQ